MHSSKMGAVANELRKRIKSKSTCARDPVSSTVTAEERFEVPKVPVHVRGGEGRFMVLCYKVCMIITPKWATPCYVLLNVSVSLYMK